MKKYIKDIISPKDAFVDQLDDIDRMNSLHEEYDYIFKERFDDTKASQSRSLNKLSGNIATYLVKQFVENVVGSRQIFVSEPNCYILGSRAEYDLLVLKKGVFPLKNMNIYLPEYVEAVIEVKNSGLFGRKSTKPKPSGNTNDGESTSRSRTIKEETSDILEAYHSAKKLNSNIKFAYVTLAENNVDPHNEDYLSLTEKYLRDTTNDKGRVFCFNPNSSNFSDKNVHKPEYDNWEHFVHECIIG